jgi:hypothetical protein
MAELGTGSAQLSLACEAARQGDWMKAQQLLAPLVEHSMPLGAMARLNILVCHYHLGHVALIPERALPLLPHLPFGARLACAGLSLLAARKNETLLSYKEVVLALCDPANEPLDLPTVPTFVALGADPTACSVLESSDGALMSEVVHVFLHSGLLSPTEAAQLQSLAGRYRERASIVAAADLRRPPTAPARRKPWWKPWQ